MQPMVKSVIAMRSRGLRPKISENDAKAGWKTVLERRKDVPAQKASMAVPWSLDAMMGRATEMEVASRATTRVIWWGMLGEKCNGEGEWRRERRR